MTKKNLYHGAWKLRATAALVLALALSTFPAAFSRAVNAQTPPKASAQTPAKTTAPAARESKGGQNEGIKVHGHWTIDVRNPDGTLVTHSEFENALTAQGKDALAQYLARVSTVGLWQILLTSTGTNPWGSAAGGIVEQNDPNAASGNPPNPSKVLTVSYNGTNSTISLSGNITAPQAGGINMVETRNFYCSPTVGASGCTQGFVNIFSMTATAISSPANGSCPVNTVCVVAGQIVQVTVVISFS